MSKPIHIDRHPDRHLTCPICMKQSLLHHCLENAVKVVYKAGDELVEIWEADLYKCGHCGELVMTDFGKNPQWTSRGGWRSVQGPADVQAWLNRIETEAKKRGSHGVIYIQKRTTV